MPPALSPSSSTALVDLNTVIQRNADRPVVVFPECTTTNGRGILRFSPSLLSAPATVKIFPVNLRYTAPDITTAVPREYLRFLWNLCSRPTHCIRVRIAECTYNTAAADRTGKAETTGAQADMNSSTDTLADSDIAGEGGEGLSLEERKVLDRVGEALARLGRVKRVGLGVREKVDFVRAWTRKRR
jgi:1-acylglycerol-3-phosphate O-acyltransferase